MRRQDAGFHPARIIFSCVLAVLLSGLYAAGTGGFVLELVQFTTSSLGFNWSPEQLSGTARTALGIAWFALVVPVFMAVLFRSFLVSAIWQVFRHGSWVESTREANKKLADQYRVHRP